MKLRLLVCGYAAGLLTAFVAGAYMVQGDDELPSEEEMHQLWQKYGMPNKHHAVLERGVGEWDVTMRTWWSGTDKEPEVNHAVAHSEMIFDGRFMKTELEGTIKFEFQGVQVELPILGLGITGYDSFKKKYVSTWIDSHNTAIWMSEGRYDPTGEAFTYFGTSDDWMTGQHDKPVKWTDRWVDDDTVIAEMHDLMMPGESKVFEMTMKRRPSTAKRD
jgi:hypothetical protein